MSHQRWTEKGFGFIERPDFGDSIFCHNRETPDRAALVPGSKVSFVYENDEKGGKAKNVLIEEGIVEDDSARETGTIQRWNAEKGFGFIGRANGGEDAFVHKKDCGGKDLVKGQAVSFVVEAGPKGASAKNVREEEGGAVGEEAVEEDEGERELGKVKSYNEEKGFAFIGRCAGGDDVFGHKREFGGVKPYVGQPVSFILETTEKGDTAKKIRQEDSVPEPILSDMGREFGTVKVWGVLPSFLPSTRVTLPSSLPSIRATLPSSLPSTSAYSPNTDDVVELQHGERFRFHCEKEGRGRCARSREAVQWLDITEGHVCLIRLRRQRQRTGSQRSPSRGPGTRRTSHCQSALWQSRGKRPHLPPLFQLADP